MKQGRSRECPWMQVIIRKTASREWHQAGVRPCNIILYQGHRFLGTYLDIFSDVERRTQPADDDHDREEAIYDGVSDAGNHEFTRNNNLTCILIWTYDVAEVIQHINESNTDVQETPPPPPATPQQQPAQPELRPAPQQPEPSLQQPNSVSLHDDEISYR